VRDRKTQAARAPENGVGRARAGPGDVREPSQGAQPKGVRAERFVHLRGKQRRLGVAGAIDVRAVQRRHRPVRQPCLDVPLHQAPLDERSRARVR
jgi:hypothetical protein